ncbi:MAG: hypothetical protein JNK79_14880 [Chitinophagaceae bacterium]|nr:hypothetical protein [Chitinophagaceae bacterium]
MPEISVNNQKILYQKEGNRITFWGKSLPEKSFFVIESNNNVRFHYPYPPNQHFIENIQPQLQEFFQSLYKF